MAETGGGTIEITNSGASSGATFDVDPPVYQTMTCFVRQGDVWVVCDQFVRQSGAWVTAASEYNNAGTWQPD